MRDQLGQIADPTSDLADPITDQDGNEIFSSGERDDANFIEPGSFLFKAEPVDQYGNLIDRHNLWEMVGVRYRRALFPGYSDTVEYTVDVPKEQMTASEGELTVDVRLMYRKVDQFLINFLLGEDSGLTAPVIEMARTTTTVPVVDSRQAAAGGEPELRIGG